MAKLEYKFSKEDIDLIGIGKITHTFNEQTDYVRLNVFNDEDELLYSFASNKPLFKKPDGTYYFDEYHVFNGKYRTGKKFDD